MLFASFFLPIGITLCYSMLTSQEKQMNAYMEMFVASGYCIPYKQAVWLLSRLRVVVMIPKADLVMPAFSFSITTVLGKVSMLFLYNMIFWYYINWDCCKVYIAALPLKCSFQYNKQNKQQRKKKKPEAGSQFIENVTNKYVVIYWKIWTLFAYHFQSCPQSHHSIFSNTIIIIIIA